MTDDQLKRWKAAQSAHNAAQRRGRGGRPAPAVTGFRVPAPPVQPPTEPVEPAGSNETEHAPAPELHQCRGCPACSCNDDDCTSTCGWDCSCTDLGGDDE